MIGKHISKKEITCKCGCGFSSLSQKTIDVFDAVRDRLKKPIHINSGCRCERHNMNIGGAPNSAHLAGRDGVSYALDIKVADTFDRFIIIEELFKLGVKRIGVYESFIHFDTSPYHPQKVMWTGKG